MSSLWRVRLLTAVLAAATGACGGDEGNESRLVCYEPGKASGDLLTPMPGPPCLERDDGRLQALNPGCTTDFAVTSGPEQRADASGPALCCYGIRFNTVSGCAVGRPLRSGEGPIVASLRPGRGWGG